MGTPAQDFRFHLDTGSSDLWTNVADSTFCRNNQAAQQGSDIFCSISGTYAANDSSTYKYISSAFQIQYADGSQAVGDYVSDIIRIGSINLVKQQFGVGYISTSAEGVMGIGYVKLEAQYQNAPPHRGAITYPNIPQTMADQGYINSNAYSLWLDDLNSSTGNILFGGVDTNKYQGLLRTLDIVQEDGGPLEMLVSLDSIVFHSGKANTIALSNTTTALLDSGATLTYVPDDTANIIYRVVGAQYSSRQGLAFVPCSLANSTDTLSFNFSGKIIMVAMSEMVFAGGISRNLDCTFGIVPQNSATSAITTTRITLGDSFIRNAYIVYDLANNQISLAQTNNKANTSNIMEIGTGVNSVPDVAGNAAPAAPSLLAGAGNVQAPGSSLSSNSTPVSSSAFAAPTNGAGDWWSVAGIGAAVVAIML